MKNNLRSVGLKSKIILVTLTTVIISFILVFSVCFVTLFQTMNNVAEAKFKQLSQKYGNNFQSIINDATNYLVFLSSYLEDEAENSTDREILQTNIYDIFTDYSNIDGSSIYFEPNAYDDSDLFYKNTQFGTEQSGRIAWYFYIEDNQVKYLPEALSNDSEFEMEHYMNCKTANAPIYTDPTVYEIDGATIPMFTLAYPIRGTGGEFIGAVTVDLFLDDIYEQLVNENIYKTGYIIIGNDREKVVYSPIKEDIGKTRKEAGIAYSLPDGESTGFFNSRSIINDSKTLVTIDAIYIERLDCYFYISVSAPSSEINRDALILMTVLMIAGLAIIGAVALVFYYIIGKISSPFEEITEGLNKISAGDYKSRIKGSYTGEFAKVKDSVNTMATRIEEYIDESKNSLKILKNILNGMDAYLYVTDPDTDEILFVNDNMRKHFDLSEDNGDICWKVLQSGFTKRCDFCPCHQLEKAPDVPVVWEEHNTVTKRYYRNTDLYIDWLMGKKVHLQHSVDITEIKEAQIAIDKRLKQQALMAAISQSFLTDEDTDLLIGNLLRVVGEFLEIPQVLFYKICENAVTLKCENEWLDPKYQLPSRIGLRINLSNTLLSILATVTDAKEFVICSNNPQYSEITSQYRRQFSEFITAPIFINGKLFAALDLSREVMNKEWSESEVSLVTFAAGILTGVLEKVSIEDQLKRLSSIVESSPQLIIYVNSKGEINYANPATLLITEHSEEYLREGGLDAIFDRETVEQIKESYIPTVLDKGIVSFETGLINKNGKRLVTLFSGFKIGKSTDNIGFIGRDITDIRELEKELIGAKELAEQGSVAKSEFLSRMSHEMRTPMNAIIGMTNIAKGTADTAKKEHCLDKIDNASKHLLGVINDILDMSKIEANKLELSFSEFSFERMLASIVNVISFRIEEKHQTFSTYIDPLVPKIIISDEQHLKQVIANLLSNAVKFTPEKGEISFSAKLLKKAGNMHTVEVEVADNGIGISAKQQEKLFRPFEQADSSIAGKFGGTGLGLAISKRIIDLMSGEMRIESEPEKGSKFIFTFNAEEGVGEENQVELPESNSLQPLACSFEGKSALLAEDVEINREIILTILEDTKLNIECAENGLIAVEMFAKNPGKYDIIFMDVQMPELDGLGASRRIRLMNPEGAKVPIIAMTANVFSEDIAKCLAAGMNEHIGKPISFDELFIKLKKYLT